LSAMNGENLIQIFCAQMTGRKGQVGKCNHHGKIF
jgi:hypothetical protein